MKNESRGKLKRLCLLPLCFAMIVSSCQLARTQSASNDTLMFEGTLEKLGADPGTVSGRLAIYRLAKYRVEKVCAGEYEHEEIVVDHLIFTGKEFGNIKIGERVCVKVKVSREINVRNNAEGIRTPNETVNIFYVASEAPVRLSDDTECCVTGEPAKSH